MGVMHETKPRSSKKTKDEDWDGVSMWVRIERQAFDPSGHEIFVIYSSISYITLS